MDKRKLGDIEVSEIGMGCMAFSHGYGKIPEKSYAVECIRAAFDAGCTFFDTAEIYGPNLSEPGHNELIVGEALADVRQHVQIATKLHIPTAETKEKGLYETIRLHLEGSLARLKTDFADLYYLHRINEDIPVEDVAHVMGRLIREGLIRSWGLSQVEADTIERADRVTHVSAVQNLYNMLERDCEERVFPYCLVHNIGVVPFSPVASGFLSGRVTADTQYEKIDDVRNWVPQMTEENRKDNMPIVNLISEYAKNKGATSAQISLAWMLKKYPNVVPIPGSKNKEHILENLGAADVKLSDGEFAALEKALDALPVHGHRGIVESNKRVHP